MVDLTSPVLLSADNFTPLSRTPWAGRVIAQTYKKFVKAQLKDDRIGEAWEFSCDPQFPSRVLGSHLTLNEVIEKQSSAVLSPSYVKTWGPHCEILVKLLNADQPLSLQVHPQDDDPHLKPEESGKPESWLVLNARPNAGLYLGFSQPINKNRLRKILLNGDQAKDYLQFVKVQPGDYFEIEPGVPHAIGPGVVLLEPQRIVFGKSGKTYRFWDWGRKYNDQGELDLEHGRARELHLEEGLCLVNPEQQVGLQFVNTLKRKSLKIDKLNGAEVVYYPKNNYYQVIHCKSDDQAEICIDLENGYAALIMLNGMLVPQSNRLIKITTGQPALLPHRAMPLSASLQRQTEFCLVIPASSDIQIS